MEGNFIKEEFYDEISKTHETDPLVLSDGDYQATNINDNDNDIKRKYMKEELVLEENIKVENESIVNEYKYKEIKDDKNNIDIKENIIECSVVKSDVNSSSVYEDGNKHGSIRGNFGGEATSVSGDTSLSTEWIVQNYKQTPEQNCGFIESAKQHYNDKCFVCELCGKRFSCRKTFCVHVQIHEKKVYKCHICDKHLSHNSVLKEHLKRHQGIRNYQCNICLKYFVYHSDLKRHLQIHEDKKYECDICGCKLKQKCIIIYHIKELHTDRKQFQCEICKKYFARRYNVQKHMVLHGASSEHQCHMCKKYFSDLHKLKRHFETHTNVKYSFKCDHCDKLFAHESSLSRHMKVHGNIKYTCDTCGNTFSYKFSLSKHLNQHTYL